MAQKELIAPKYQKRLLVIIIAVVLIESVSSFIFAAQNDFLAHASEGFLQSTIVAVVLPILLFMSAFLAISEKISRLSRATLAIVWASAGMLLNLLLVVGSYFISYDNYGTPMNYLYLPLAGTAVLYAIGLLLWARKSTTLTPIFISKGFQRAYIIMATVYALIQVAFLGISLYQYADTLDMVSFVVFSVVSIVLGLVLAISGYVYLKPITSRLSRLFFSVVSVAIAFYIGTAISSVDVFVNSNDVINIFVIVSYVISGLIYIPLVRVIRKELSRKA